MIPFNNNPCDQSFGKIAVDIEKYISPTGQVVEIRRSEENTMQNNLVKKHRCFEVSPPLADGRIPESATDIRECHCCLGLFHMENVLRCPMCGNYYCLACRKKIKVKEKEISVCILCAEEHNRNILHKVCKKFWNLGI